MAEQFIDLEAGGFINARHIIKIEVNGRGDWIAQYQIGGSTERALLDTESAEAFLKNIVTSIDD